MLIKGPLDVRHAALQRLVLGALPKVAATAIEPIPAAAPVPAQSQPQPSVAMLVAISACDPRAQRQRMIAAADKGLRALETLHADLIMGRAQLGEIAAWLKTNLVPDDPAAAELARAVELRVLVELAKADRDSAGQGAEPYSITTRT